MRTADANDPGAAALELALLLPLLILIVTGVIEFGRLYDTQIELQHAASVGAREYAISKDQAAGENAARAAATGLDPGQLTVTSTACTPEQPVTVTVEHPFAFNLPFFPAPSITLSADGVMQCIGAAP